MFRRGWFVSLLVVGLCAVWAAWRSLNAAEPAAELKAAPEKAAAPGKATESQFIRVVRDKSGTPTAMQTAVAHYTATEGKYAGVKVDLIGAVHVGEADYYSKLNDLFTKYDVLLYELVAPKGTKIPKGETRRSNHPVGLMQHGMSDMLGLVHQMTEIDYTKKNFVHADMTPDEFSAKMDERGESWWSMAFRAMGQGIAMQAAKPNEHPEFEMLFALFDDHPELRLKRAMAKQFESMEGVMDAFGGEEGSTIITERNKKAFEVLAKQLKKGKQTVGVFYGAGHLPDMHDRLLADFGLKLVGVDWLTAWDMSGAAKPVAEKKPDVAKPTKKKRSK
jgi:hypothetical protein